MHTTGREGDTMEQEHQGCAGCAAGTTRRDMLRNAAIGAALMLGLGARRGSASVVPRLLSGTVGQEGMLTYPVPDDEGVFIDRQEATIVVRTDGRLYAFYLSCPHQNTALHWIEKHHQFECPKHHSKYQPDGEFISGRATRSMDRFAVSLDNGSLVVDTNTLFRQDENPDAWANAYVELSGAGASASSGSPEASGASPSSGG